MKNRPSIYAATDGDACETERSLRLLLLPPGRWQPGPPVWGKPFFSTTGPHLLEVHRLAGSGKFREIAVLDLEFPAAGDSNRSLENGAVLLAAHGGMRHAPLLRRLAAEKNSGFIPGHAATIFALLAAEFHLHPMALLQGWLFQEWVAIQGDKSDPSVTLFLEQCAVRCSLLPQLLAQFHGQNPPRLAAL